MIQRAVVLYVSYFPVRCCSKSESHMKTKTTEIPFTDYNVNTTGALFLAPILSLTFSQEVIKLQYSARSGVAKIPLCRYISPSRALELFTTLSTKERQFYTLFYSTWPGTFELLSNYQFCQKFPPGRYTRDARNDPNRTPRPNRRELR